MIQKMKNVVGIKTTAAASTSSASSSKGRALLCLGSNFFGQLGLGLRTRENQWQPSPFGSSESEALDYSLVKDVQAGSQFSLVLSVSGEISFCGILNGMVFPVLSPVEILWPLKCSQLACGRKHMLALMEGGCVLSWGTGYFGQLGHGDDSSWDNPKMIHALEPSHLGARVTRVVCGGSHSGCLTEQGKAYMWGLNKSGQCGVTVRTDSVMEPALVDMSVMEGGAKARLLVCGRNHSAMVTHMGRVYTWGASSFGRLGLSDTRKIQPLPCEVTFFSAAIPVLSLASGDFHMLALGEDGGVYSWGYGSEGQTGQSSLLHLRSPRRIDSLDEFDIVSVACGGSFSMAVSRLGRLYAWGYGDGGWLGISPPSPSPAIPLPYFESENAAEHPIIDAHSTCSFDSNLNVLVPRCVKLLATSKVEGVRCGGGHTVLFVSLRSPEEEKECAAYDEKNHEGDELDGKGGRGAEEDGKDGDRDRDEQLISWCRHKKIPEILNSLSRGANVNVRDALGNTVS